MSAVNGNFYGYDSELNTRETEPSYFLIADAMRKSNNRELITSQLQPKSLNWLLGAA